jgi:hypothetical protein
MALTSKPIFIVSAPRSGSTLLRLILDAHPRLAVPPPAWLYELVYPYLYSYGDLSSNENFRALAEDILEAPTIKNWPTTLSADELTAASAERSFAGLFDALHRHYAVETGKERWGEKTPRNCFWMDEIRQDFPDVQFIHLIRDGRDMAIDISETPFMMPCNIYSGAKMWKDFTAAVLESAPRFDHKSYFEIRYEALCVDPEKELRRLCRFLGEDFDPAMLKHHDTSSTKTWSAKAGHVKTSDPITARYCMMYKNRLPEGDYSALNALIGDLLMELGYSVEEAPRPISPRLASQLLESDSVSAPHMFPYRQWHEQRRKERREKGVWKDSGRDSLLRALH